MHRQYLNLVDAFSGKKSILTKPATRPFIPNPVTYMVVFTVVKDTFSLPSISLLPLESQKYSLQVNRSPFSRRIFLMTQTPKFDVMVVIVTYVL